MYTGIVQEVGSVLSVESCEFGTRISVQCSQDFLSDIVLGASVSMNGTCFTVVDSSVFHSDNPVHKEKAYFTVEATQATLDITNIKDIAVNSLVNIERSSKIGEENGGHQIAGHVLGTGKIVELKELPHGRLRIELPTHMLKYVFEKGYIAINGVSLTIADIDVETSIVGIHLVPHTMKTTNLLTYKVNDELNIEIDQMTKTIVDTVNHALLAGRQRE